MTRPYWFTDAKTESGVYLGFTRGEWPIQAFSTDGTHAAHWAAEDPCNRIIVGPIAIPDDAPVLRGETVPAEQRLIPYEATR